MIKNESYIHIGGRMLNDLNLRWNELIVYATIHSFTNGTDDHCFHWSASYLWERCWIDKRSIYRVLKKLEANWLIERKERVDNGVKFVDYYTPSDTSVTTSDKMSVGGSDKMSHHNNSSFDNNSSFNNTSIIDSGAENPQPLNSLVVSGEEKKKKSSAEKEKKKPRTDIDELIGEIKAVCDEYGIAYDKKYDRHFARHILDAKEFWEFCDKIGQSRMNFAVNVLIASIKINYFKGACSGPMKIYQNYAEVYNQTAMKHNKQSSLVWFLPWLNIW